MSSDDDHLMGDNDDNAMMVAPEGEEGDLGYNGVYQPSAGEGQARIE